MKRIVLPMLVVALLAVTAMRLPAHQKEEAADSTKPVAVLSIASYDRIMADVAMFGNLAGNPDLDKNLEGMLKLFTQGQGLKGLDQTRPWCITLATDDISFQPLVYLPVDDLKQLLESLSGLIGEADDIGDGIFELNVFGQQVLVKETNKWAIIGQAAEAINAAPSNPTKLLAGLETKYDVALRLYVQNIPEVYRSLAIDQLRMGVESGLGRGPDEGEAEYEARREITEKQLEVLTTAINDIDQITLGAVARSRRQERPRRPGAVGRAGQQDGQADGEARKPGVGLCRLPRYRCGGFAQPDVAHRQGRCRADQVGSGRASQQRDGSRRERIEAVG